jgi:hypothetical protein
MELINQNFLEQYKIIIKLTCYSKVDYCDILSYKVDWLICANTSSWYTSLNSCIFWILVHQLKKAYLLLHICLFPPYQLIWCLKKVSLYKVNWLCTTLLVYPKYIKFFVFNVCGNGYYWYWIVLPSVNVWCFRSNILSESRFFGTF